MWKGRSRLLGCCESASASRPYPRCARRLVRPRQRCSQECRLERRCGDRWLVKLSSDVRKVRELPGLSSLHLLLIVFKLSSAPSVDETEYSTEGVNMRHGPFLERSRPPACNLIHGWKDLRIVELAFVEEAEACMFLGISFP